MAVIVASLLGARMCAFHSVKSMNKDIHPQYCLFSWGLWVFPLLVSSAKPPATILADLAMTAFVMPSSTRS